MIGCHSNWTAAAHHSSSVRLRLTFTVITKIYLHAVLTIFPSIAYAYLRSTTTVSESNPLSTQSGRLEIYLTYSFPTELLSCAGRFIKSFGKFRLASLQ